MDRYNMDRRLSSALQERILRHICITPNADYKTISKETDRDRITILQSLKPLIRHRYVRPTKLDPKLMRSKLLFKPTAKGIMYSSAYLGVDMDAIREAQLGTDTLSEYRAFIQKVPDREGRKQLEPLEAQIVINHNLFDEDGSLIFKDRKQYLKQVLRIGLLAQASDKRFDIEDLFKISFNEIIKMAHPVEVDVFREVLTKIRDNLEEALKRLPS